MYSVLHTCKCFDYQFDCRMFTTINMAAILTQMLEVALLMGLMCKYSCEECDFITFKTACWDQAKVEPGTILDNLDRLLNQVCHYVC